MKQLILFFSIILTSCTANYEECPTSSEEADRVSCETNTDCLNKFDSSYICIESDDYRNKKTKTNYVFSNSSSSKCMFIVPEKQCVVDLCAGFDTNLGTCELYVQEIGYTFADVVCNEGYLKKNDLVTNKTTCIENICTSSDYCKDTMVNISDEDVYYSNSPVCSNEGKCTRFCFDDFDCYGELTICSELISCFDLAKIQCNENEYADPYFLRLEPNGNETQTDRICSSYCNPEDDCGLGFTCGQNHKCVPLCDSEYDCQKDKFSEGNHCDSNLHYCVE